MFRGRGNIIVRISSAPFFLLGAVVQVSTCIDHDDE